ncbi:sulfur carrier protein ThiS [Falsiporphyromonas endometrii]|uniref:Sulfur carrier protein ThiS n=1 Tax=Falsiporphyromonas endometrii TaxID=1387297 RepID=A0ABV9K944_9PORP
MTIYFNEKPDVCEDGCTLSAFLHNKDLLDKRVAVAVDDHLIRKEDWDDFVLREGQYVVVITATFGG